MEPFWTAAGSESYLWDSVQIDNLFMPGISTVDCPIKDDVEKPKPKGTKGAKLKNQGQEVPEITITTEITDPGEWEYFQEYILPILRKAKKDGAREPIDVYHPKLALNEITQMFRVGYDIQGPKDQVLTVVITGYEWTDYPKAVAAAQKKTPLKSTNAADDKAYEDWSKAYDEQAAAQDAARNMSPEEYALAERNDWVS